MQEANNTQDKIEIRKSYHLGRLGRGIKAEIPLKNNKRDGIEKWYRKNGKLYCEIPYKNGREVGIKGDIKKIGD